MDVGASGVHGAIVVTAPESSWRAKRVASMPLTAHLPPRDSDIARRSRERDFPPRCMTGRRTRATPTALSQPPRASLARRIDGGPGGRMQQAQSTRALLVGTAALRA